MPHASRSTVLATALSVHQPPYTLSSIAVNFRVTQVVDKTLGIHSMIPKKLFIKDPDTYWFRAN